MAAGAAVPRLRETHARLATRGNREAVTVFAARRFAAAVGRLAAARNRRGDGLAGKDAMERTSTEHDALATVAVPFEKNERRRSPVGGSGISARRGGAHSEDSTMVHAEDGNAQPADPRSPWTRFYHRSTPWILGALVVSLPVLYVEAQRLPANNDIEAWLPQRSAVRADYEKFHRDFGMEELILVGIPQAEAEPKLVEALAARIDRIPGIRHCWTPARMQAAMAELAVPEDEALKRLRGLLVAADGSMIGVAAMIDGRRPFDRKQIVADVRTQIAYCHFDPAGTLLTGSPVIVDELDRLGSQESSRGLFAVTLLVSLTLLYSVLRHWGLSFSLVGASVWGVQLTQALFSRAGGEMNFVLNALPVLVNVFTLSIAIHFLNYYCQARRERNSDPLGTALRHSWLPCLLSSLTTVIGLLSLNVSSIRPVDAFGLAAALGSAVSLLVGLGVTPALLVVWPAVRMSPLRMPGSLARFCRLTLRRRSAVLTAAAVLLLAAVPGLWGLSADVNPVEFLPEDNRVSRDLRRVEDRLTPVDSIEAVVDFGEASTLSFVERLERVRELEAVIGRHPAVAHATSLASFFPSEWPGGPVSMMRLLASARSQPGRSEYIAAGDRYWRISARIRRGDGRRHSDVVGDLQRATAGAPITFTGIAPLLETAQLEIFRSFWESFAAAFVVIYAVMIVALRSFKAGTVAMIPNLVPIGLVFGALGYAGINVDVGMMMAGSIALGVSVDCTFHFMLRYHAARRDGKSVDEAIASAVEQTGEPMLESTVIAALGMLALTMSQFAPTARFGYLMAAQLAASILGELVLLPALLRQAERARRLRQPASRTLPALDAALERMERVA